MPKLIAPPQPVTQNKQQLAQSNLLEFGFCLDKSSSMSPYRTQVIGGYNALADEQRAIPSRVVATLVEFGSSENLIFDNIPVIELPGLTSENYLPNGGTALLDGLGLTMDRIGQRFDAAPENSVRVLIAILSDGAENSSRKRTLPAIIEEINFRRLEDEWEFLFLAAGEAAASYGLKLSIPRTHIINFLAADVKPLLLKLSRAMRHYRLGDRDYLRLMQ